MVTYMVIKFGVCVEMVVVITQTNIITKFTFYEIKTRLSIKIYLI